MAESRQSLSVLGLSTLEADVLSSLVAHPGSSHDEIAEVVGEPHEVSDALVTLAAHGLATRIPGAVARYTATAPDAALAGLIAERESSLRAARDVVDRLTEIHREAIRFTHPAHLVEVVSGQNNIADRVAQVQATAHTQIRGFDKPPYVRDPPGNFAAQTARIRDGIDYRVVYDRDATAWPGYLNDVILPLHQLGEQSRVAAQLPIKLFIVDDRTAIVPVTASRHAADAAYVVHPSALLDSLIMLFELLWATATPVAQLSPGPDLDPTARRLLTLLASGATDASIARALGWSDRTTQRRMRTLMADLEVSTRFQAGLRARERGWI